MIKSTSLKVIVALGLLAGWQVTSAAPSFAGPACDPKIMEALNSKAWAEAQREVTMNESFIYKPDSVFALSCFQSALNKTPTAFSSGSPTTAASNAISSSYQSNFAHGYTGASGSQSLTDTSCTIMRDVWNRSRCFNIPNVSGNANTAFNAFAFTSLSNATRSGYSSPGAGNYPSNCSTTYPTAVYTSSNTLLTTVGVGATFDNANLFLNVTDPLASLAASTNCSPGILTGVEIGTASTTYKEKVCPNPGCVPKFVSPDMKCCDQNNLSARCEP